MSMTALPEEFFEGVPRQKRLDWWRNQTWPQPQPSTSGEGRTSKGGDIPAREKEAGGWWSVGGTAAEGMNLSLN